MMLASQSQSQLPFQLGFNMQQIKLDSLPPELQQPILSLLSINDLQSCFSASDKLKGSVEEVLKPVTTVFCEDIYFDDTDCNGDHLAFTLREMAPRGTISHAVFSRENIGPLLKFMADKCPKLTSLMASSLSISLKDLSVLGSKLESFSLDVITDMGFVIDDVETLAANLPKLQFFKLRCTWCICPQDLIDQYSLLPQNKLRFYQDDCIIHDPCEQKFAVQSLDSLRYIQVYDLALAIHELRPTSLDSLQFFFLSSGISLTGLPSLPNLLLIHCRPHSVILNMSELIPLLYNSPRLCSAYLEGIADERTIEALNTLLYKCKNLKLLSLNLIKFFQYSSPNDDDDHRPILDLKPARRLKVFSWKSDYEMPFTLIVPKCENILCEWERFILRAGARSYEIIGDNGLASLEVGASSHPVTIEFDELPSDPSLDVPQDLTRIFSTISLVKLSITQDCQLGGLITALEEFMEENVSEIVIVIKTIKVLLGPSTYELWAKSLHDLFTLINKSVKVSFSMEIHANEKANAAIELVKGEVTRAHTISEDPSQLNPLVIVKIPAADAAAA